MKKVKRILVCCPIKQGFGIFVHTVNPETGEVLFRETLPGTQNYLNEHALIFNHEENGFIGEEE